jgi:hypothetical protein
MVIQKFIAACTLGNLISQAAKKGRSQIVRARRCQFGGCEYPDTSSNFGVAPRVLARRWLDFFPSGEFEAPVRAECFHFNGFVND